MDSSRKRLRSDSTHSSSGPLVEEPTKDENLWYSDGNIVLSVGTKLFKIHKSILASYSSVFKDMWDLPQPEGVIRIDGVDVLEMKLDDPDEWKDFLGVIYYGHESTWELDPLGFSRLASRLRLSTKYLFDGIRAKAVKVLEDNCGTHPRFPEDRPDPKSLYAMAQIHPALVIRLAEECNVPSILPSVFYDLLTLPRYPRLRLLKTEVQAVQDVQSYWRDPNLKAVHLTAVLIADNLIRMSIQDFKGWGLVHEDGDREDEESSLQGSCRVKSLLLMQKYYPRLMNSINIWDDLLGIASLDKMSEFRLCDRCGKKGSVMVNRLRLDLWDRWPSMLGLR